MRKKPIYIAVIIFIVIILVGLLSWSFFVGKQQQDLARGAKDLGYAGDITGGSSGGGGILKGAFGDLLNNESAPKDFSNTPKATLQQLYNLPIAGFIKKRANAIRFVDRATGHVFEKELPNRTTSRIDQTTIPKVYESFFLNNGESVVRRYVNESEEVVTILTDLGNEDIENTFLSSEILELVVSPSGEEFVFVEKTGSGSSIIISDSKGENQREVFTSGIRNWNIDWEGDSIFLTQKASGSLPGSAYIIDAISGSVTLALQQFLGLSANLSPDGNTILYSTIEGSGLPVLAVKNLETNTILELNVTGFAEKCVWHPTDTKVYCALPTVFPEGEYPDIWYRGEVQFTDSLWEIDTETGLVANILPPSQNTGVALDMRNLRMDTKGSILFFINNIDQTLWSVTFPKFSTSNI